MSNERMLENGDISYMLRSSMSRRPFRKQAVDKQDDKVKQKEFSLVSAPAVLRFSEEASNCWISAVPRDSSPNTSKRSDCASDSFSDSTYSQLSDMSYGGRSQRSMNTTSSDSDNNRFFQDPTLESDNRIKKSNSSSRITDEDEADTRKILMLMKVILFLRQNCTAISTKYTPGMACAVLPYSRHSGDLHGSDGIGIRKRISFSPVTLLFSAIAEKSFEEAKAILDTEDIDVNTQSPSGQSLLHLAAGNADLKCIDLLLQSGSRVNIKDSSGWTPLHAAIRRGNWKSAIVLIEAGADIAKYAERRIQEYQSVLEKSRNCYRMEEIFV